MNEEELSALTVAKLKERLKELGLSTSGKKADLISRIIDSVEDEEIIIIDDDDETTYVATEIEEDEILEAEVFEAEILEEDEEEESIFVQTVPSSVKMSDTNKASSGPWFKDGTTIATVLVVIILAGAGGWWYLNTATSDFQTVQSSYGDDLQFTVSEGLLLADGEDMVKYVRDAAGGGLDQVCGELRIEFDGSGSSSITNGDLMDLKEPSDIHLEGAVMVNGPYGRTWNAVESNLVYDLNADMSGYTWSAIDQDSCSSNTDWNRRNNQLDIEITQWNEITERTLLRSDTSVSFVDSDGQSSSVSATTFGGIVDSDTISEMLEAALLPMHPVNLYDIFQIQTLSDGVTGEHEGWRYEVGSTDMIGGQEAIQIHMHHIDIGNCLGRAEMVLWAISGQPLPARQIVDIAIDKSQSKSTCNSLLSAAIDLSFPDGTFVSQYTLEQTSFVRGKELLDWQQPYNSRPLSGEDVPSQEDRLEWITHMWDNSTIRSFTLEKAVACVTTDAEAFPDVNSALNADGYIFAAKDDRTGSDDIWNLSWVSSTDAGWVRVAWPGGENCYNSGDGFIGSEDKPEHAHDKIPATHRLGVLENRIISSQRYPDLYPQLTTNGNVRDDVQFGYVLVVPEDNAVSDWLEDINLGDVEGQVTVYLERTWSSGGLDHTLQVGMDGKTGRMGGWIHTSTPI
ncbi:MAG: SAP domain-containing protein [Candidatus Thermoplasmatota archaeon]|nr:SAP domain-containing protein [Candidatus Thermoplasmatota archaeon]